MRYRLRSAYGLHGVFDTREEAEETRAVLIEVDLRYVDSKVVRVLSHEEAKRKAVALALVKAAAERRAEASIAEGCDNSQWVGTMCVGLRSAAQSLENEAEKLWPALFHGGDGKTPRGK